MFSDLGWREILPIWKRKANVHPTVIYALQIPGAREQLSLAQREQSTESHFGV